MLRLGMLILLCTAGAAAAQDQVRVGSGSAFVVNPDGYLLTCAHVVKDATAIQVSLGGDSYPARVIAVDRSNDVALVRVPLTGLTPLPLAGPSAVALGEEVRVCGYPLAGMLGVDMKITRGIVSGITTVESHKALQVDAPVNPGNSGGPLLNLKGEVVGVVNLKLRAEGVDGIGFAVPVRPARRILNDQGISFTEGAEGAPALEGTVLAQRALASVALVMVKTEDSGEESAGQGPTLGPDEAGPALLTAAARGDLGVARTCLEQGADPSFHGERDLTPLHLAVMAGHQEMVDLLLSHGADANAVEEHGWTALHGAAMFARPEAAKALLHHGARVDARDVGGRTPLHLAALHGHLNVTRLLLDSGADLRATSDLGWTPLHWAAAGSKLDVAGFLLRRGARVNVQDRQGWRPLHWAAIHGDAAMARLLLTHGADTRVRTSEGSTPADLALKKGHASLGHLLKERQVTRGRR